MISASLRNLKQVRLWVLHSKSKKTEIMMILPENGSVVVIDDDPNQARPIIDALAKKGIATTYFTGKGENDLPKNPLSNVRLAIVDLQLIDGTGDPHTIIMSLINKLKQIISSENGPYMILIWSLKKQLYGENFMHQIKNSEHRIVPVFIASLEKSDCIRRKDNTDSMEIADNVINEIKARFGEEDLKAIRDSIINNIQQDEQFEATPNAIEIIEKSLKSALEKAGVFHLLIIWENLTRKAGYQTVNSVSSTIEYSDLWESNMRDVFKRMSKAKTGQNTLSDDATLKSALSTFSGVFSEELEFDIRKLSFPNYIELESKFSIAGALNGDTIKIIVYPDRKKWRVKVLKNERVYLGIENVKLENISILADRIPEPEKSFIDSLVQRYLEIPFRINTKLHIEIEPAEGHMPGNVYRIKVEEERKRVLLSTYLETVPEDVSNFNFVELEVSPACDYAQNKMEKSRLLSGLIYPFGFKIKSGPFYKEAPSVLIGKNKYTMVFNYRFFKALDVSVAEKRGLLWFRIKRELMQDIVAGLSGHVNRPGITEVE
jgi:hypothetical protein